MKSNNEELSAVSPFYAFLRSTTAPVFEWISSYTTSNTINSKEVVISGKQLNVQSETLISLVKAHIWCSYRKGFTTISSDNNITTDAGWGCMLRCGQMLLARALLKSYLSSPDCDLNQLSAKDRGIYQKILLSFNDTLKSHFSIHQIVLHRSENGSSSSSWFGPNAIAQALRIVTMNLINSQSTAIPIYIHVSIDQMIVVNDIVNEWNSKRQLVTLANIPLLLIIPLRTGLKCIDFNIFKMLQTFFNSPQFIGFIGGKPRRALYFIGCAEEQLLYLDPHRVQCYVPDPEFDNSTYHTSELSWLHYLNIDPSLALGFVCKNESEFWSLIDFLHKCNDEDQQNKLFDILNSRPCTDNLDYEVIDME